MLKGEIAAQLPDTILNFGSNFSARRDNFHRRSHYLVRGGTVHEVLPFSGNSSVTGHTTFDVTKLR